MAVYRQVHISYWQDPFILTLTPEEKFFYLYLMTNSKTSQCGIYELPKQVIVFETGYNLETVDKLLKKFIEYGKIRYSEETKELFIINWLKYNWSKSPSVKKCIEEEITKIKDKTFKKSIFNTLSTLCGETLTDSGEEKEKEEEKEEEKEKEEEMDRKKIPPKIEWVIQYCRERKNGIDPQKWYDYYTANGWVVGKTKMKDWQAAIRTWERNSPQHNKSSGYAITQASRNKY